MFKLKSTADREVLDMAYIGLSWKRRYEETLREYNALVKRVNAIGGEAAFKPKPQAQTFSPEDTKRLLQLCHPDKHGGSTLANEMTQKLLAMRD